jgi:hypothetical protein
MHFQKGYNVASITRSGAGQYSITFTTAFADAFYNCEFGIEATSSLTTSGITPMLNSGGRLTTGFSMTVTQDFITSPNAADPTSVYFACYGRQ